MPNPITIYADFEAYNFKVNEKITESVNKNHLVTVTLLYHHTHSSVNQQLSAEVLMLQMCLYTTFSWNVIKCLTQ